MRLTLELEREEDGRWIAEILELPGVMASGLTREGAVMAVQALALQVLGERIQHGEARLEGNVIEFRAA